MARGEGKLFVSRQRKHGSENAGTAGRCEKVSPCTPAGGRTILPRWGPTGWLGTTGGRPAPPRLHYYDPGAGPLHLEPTGLQRAPLACGHRARTVVGCSRRRLGSKAPPNSPRLHPEPTHVPIFPTASQVGRKKTSIPSAAVRGSRRRLGTACGPVGDRLHLAGTRRHGPRTVDLRCPSPGPFFVPASRDDPRRPRRVAARRPHRTAFRPHLAGRSGPAARRGRALHRVAGQRSRLPLPPGSSVPPPLPRVAYAGMAFRADQKGRA
jgi:hypothetical protein